MLVKMARVRDNTRHTIRKCSEDERKQLRALWVRNIAIKYEKLVIQGIQTKK